LHPDDPRILAHALDRAVEVADVVFCTGGASGSDADHVATAILACGGLARHVKLRLKPGKPIVMGSVREHPILGLPGNPVAAIVNFLLFGRPLLRAIVGASADRATGQGAVAAEPIPHTPGRREFLPARVTGHMADGRVQLAKLGRGGSARLRPLALADGLAEVAAGRGDLAAGEPLLFHPFFSALAP
jgi:molybdopterin molybdotransferase